MKTFALTLLATAVGFAQAQSSTTNTTTPAPKVSRSASTSQNKKPAPAAPLSPEQKAKAQSQVQSIPAGATQIEPNLYRSTDANGKTWMYRQTPFGVSRWEESSVPAALAPAPKGEPVAVTDLGDSVKFEKKTPFGESSWIRKKSDLNDEEKAIVAGADQNSAGSQVAGKTKEDK
jgi:hypothetical protein